jgi:hypothetical protein
MNNTNSILQKYRWMRAWPLNEDTRLIIWTDEDPQKYCWAIIQHPGTPEQMCISMGVVPESLLAFKGLPVGFQCDIQGDGVCHVHIHYKPFDE